MPKILGREPALWIAAVVSIISVLGTLGFTLLTGEQAALWILLVNAIAGAATAWTTRPLSPAAFTYVISALVAVATTYGLELSEEVVLGINAAVVPILILITREQVNPQETFLSRS